MELELFFVLLNKRERFKEKGNFLYAKFTLVAKIWGQLILSNLRFHRKVLFTRFAQVA